VARTLTSSGATPAASARSTRICSRTGAIRGSSPTRTQSALTSSQPASPACAEARRRRSSDDAPSHSGSPGGNSEPMSPSPAAPRMASINACAITSPSECPASPRPDSSSTPPSTSGTPSASACASTPSPTLIGRTLDPRRSLQVVEVEPRRHPRQERAPHDSLDDHEHAAAEEEPAADRGGPERPEREGEPDDDPGRASLDDEQPEHPRRVLALAELARRPNDPGDPHDAESRSDHEQGDVPGAHSSSSQLSTRARSAASVTFSSRGSPSTQVTRPPPASTSDAQSVASDTSPATARRSASARNACGVCTATRSSRRSV